MTKVLIISYYFPPIGGVASIKALKYIKYLPKYGFEPIVLCAHPFLNRSPKDKSMLKEIPPGTKIYRSWSFDLSWLMKILYGFKLFKTADYLRKNFFIPDLEKNWEKRAEKKLKMIFKYNPDIRLAFISAGPYSSLFLGRCLKNSFNIQYICEFRDEWTNNPERLNINYPAKSLRKELIWEAETLMNSVATVFLTQIMRENFTRLYPFLNSRPSAIISNGFDESDFEGLRKPHTTDSSVMNIVYCGSFYDRRQPDRLWESILRLSKDRSIELERIKFRIYGNNTNRFVLGSYKDDSELKSIVDLHSFVSHRVSLQKMNEADVLLLYIADGVNTESILTGKIFDYIRIGKPILAIIPERGLAAEIVRNSGLGFIASPENPKGIDDAVSQIYRMWSNNELFTITPNSDYVAQFQRSELAGKLASLFNKCLDNHA